MQRMPIQDCYGNPAIAMCIGTKGQFYSRQERQDCAKNAKDNG